MQEIRAEIVNLKGKFATIRLIDEIDEAVSLHCGFKDVENLEVQNLLGYQQRI